MKANKEKRDINEWYHIEWPANKNKEILMFPFGKGFTTFSPL